MGKVIREKCHATVYEIIGNGVEKMQVILKADIIQKLKEIGLEGGDNVIVQKHGLCVRRRADGD